MHGRISQVAESCKIPLVQRYQSAPPLHFAGEASALSHAAVFRSPPPSEHARETIFAQCKVSST